MDAMLSYIDKRIKSFFSRPYLKVFLRDYKIILERNFTFAKK